MSEKSSVSMVHTLSVSALTSEIPLQAKLFQQKAEVKRLSILIPGPACFEVLVRLQQLDDGLAPFGAADGLTRRFVAERRNLLVNPVGVLLA
jgi:hypothetical protein